MVEVIPAIMPKSFSEVREYAEVFSGLVETIQLDVMDGVFVPETSWPYSESFEVVESLLRDEQGLPNFSEVHYEVDLMVERPEETIHSWVSLGVSRIILHIEALPAPKETLRAIVEYIGSQREEEGTPAVELGVAIGINTPNETLHELIAYVDFIQCMGIARIGYQGEPFDTQVLSKIEHFRTIFPHLPIAIDGGVSKETTPALIRAGATRLVAGSAIIKADDIPSAVAILKETTQT